MTEADAEEKLKVFISYSRKDSTAFADELLAGLEVAGFAPFLDRHDIAPGEPWEARLGGLIEQSDTVVFVVSPEAIKSDRCEWEVDKTLALSKRLFAIIHIAVPDNLIPEKLSRLQFVRFDAGRSVTRPLQELADALRQDLNWIGNTRDLGKSRRAGADEDVPNRFSCAETISTQRRNGWPHATKQRPRLPMCSAPLSGPARRLRWPVAGRGACRRLSAR